MVSELILYDCHMNAPCHLRRRSCSNEYEPEYIKRNSCVTTVDLSPSQSEHDVSTDKVRYRAVGTDH